MGGLEQQYDYSRRGHCLEGGHLTGYGVAGPKESGHGKGSHRRWIGSGNFHIRVDQGQSDYHGYLGRDSEKTEDGGQTERYNSHVKSTYGEQVKGARLEKETSVFGFQIALHPQHHGAVYANRVGKIFDAPSQEMDAPIPETGREDFLQGSLLRRLEKDAPTEGQGNVLIE